MTKIPIGVLGVVVDHLSLAVFVFQKSRLIYSNHAAEGLRERLRASYRIEVEVMLRDHLAAVLERIDGRSVQGTAPFVTLLTATNGEPFYVHVMPLSTEVADVAVSVRVIGSDIDACRDRYGLSQREAQVAELVLHGYCNADIASTLGITPATTKKHLTRIFDKVGVDTRSQLQTRLA